MSDLREIETPAGIARAHVDASGSAGLLVLGHGAGGGVNAPDLLAARDAAQQRGLAVARVEQPYRVAGRRSPAPARTLDAAWTAVVGSLRTEWAGGPLVIGGRSSGARVACRTAGVLDPAGVLCLAFPLLPPAGRAASGSGSSRIGELEAVRVPVLIVQGCDDRFGMPPAAPGREVVALEGDHGLKRDLDGLRLAVWVWLARWR